MNNQRDPFRLSYITQVHASRSYSLGLLSAVRLLAQAPSTLDLLFDPNHLGYRLHDGIRSVNGVNEKHADHAVLMSDGRMVIGGPFNAHHTRVHERTARGPADGSTDNTFISVEVAAAV